METLTEELPEELLNHKDYKFYILDRDEKKSIAVIEETEHGYKGFSFIQERGGFNVSPFYIAKTFINEDSDRYDFTKDFESALSFSLMITRLK